ncbi:MAG TPA: hypothetical protein VFE23_20720 [Usitatibacter sp.]|nr:hypothetical protein [Usitatibacter sp.]
MAALLCGASGTLAEAHRRHVGAYGTLIPHVYMGDVLTHVGRCLGELGRTDEWRFDGELPTILAMLDRAVLEGDRETRNVVVLSFVRDGELEGFFPQLRPHFGPGLRMQVSGR